LWTTLGVDAGTGGAVNFYFSTKRGRASGRAVLEVYFSSRSMSISFQELLTNRRTTVTHAEAMKDPPQGVSREKTVQAAENRKK